MKEKTKNIVAGLSSGILAFIGQNVLFYLMTLLSVVILDPIIDPISRPTTLNLISFWTVLILLILIIPIVITSLIAKSDYKKKKHYIFWGIIIGSLIFYFLFFSGLLFLLPWYQIGGVIGL